MENQPTKLDKAVKISVIAGALIVALSIAYYLVIFLPHKTKMAFEQQQQEQQTKKEQQQQEQQTREKEQQAREREQQTRADEVKTAQDIIIDRRKALDDCLQRVDTKLSERAASVHMTPEFARTLTMWQKEWTEDCLKRYPQ